VVVGNDEHALADPRPARRGGERILVRKRMPAATGEREIGQLVDPEERRSRDVLLQIRLASGLDAVERVAAVDELVSDQ
jgi:hypothetical protein